MLLPPDFQYNVYSGEIDLAYRQDGKASAKAPGLLFLPGFFSDMTGTKASFLADKAEACGRMLTRFDYRGHGFSGGRFEEATLGDWLEDAKAILDNVAEGPQILVGSSMGGWIMLLLALARPERVKGLVGIAAAPDFTEDLLWKKLNATQQTEMHVNGVIYEPSEYEQGGIPYTLRLVEEARRHLLLNNSIPIRCPVRLLQGMKDEDVPWGWVLRIAQQLESRDIRVTLVKDGDHRLSDPQNLELLWQEIESIPA